MQVEYELIKRIYSKKTIEKYNRLSKYLGLDNNAVISFLLIRLFFSIIVFFLSFVFIHSLLIALGLTLLFNILHTYTVFYEKLKKITKVEEKEASLFFEILLIALKSGKNLNDAFILTTKNIDSGLSKKFSKAIDNTKYGESLIESLDNLKSEIYSDDIKNIIDSIIESYKSGRDMVDSIEKSLELLNENRVNNIKAYINKLPVKISVISVFLLIPLMLLLILSPAILEYFK